MHASIPLATLFLPLSLGHPTRPSSQIAHFIFHRASSSDSIALNVTTDGMPAVLQGDSKIKSIDINDYDANQQCIFKAPDDTVIEPKLDIDTETGEQRLVFAEPREVGSVSCRGMCIPVYGECYDSTGMPVGLCCNGVCAATRCRAWNAASSHGFNEK
ncbi:uncharacterized protein F5Z01DRAFT_116385 [Emericellopsis atlantica]|uniref:SSCRP protein n=1 Tax=Emericellopsis atlantica TaxID=2614577 RepID=A0A9P7ZLW1_9HYPO|nr:uncharacterized protein F5Z01DRAFT_116385 [Emericellopsis atlantica]KAG9254076.1 hypothetical protein F5Z01DRAFT_116385 [Emericellopsis atlantica]